MTANSRTIDLNADLGEDPSAEGVSRDIALLDAVTSCNIACGGHAGTAQTIKQMLAAANQKNVAAGAHPSYPDPGNFGRLSMAISHQDLADSINMQLHSITTIARDLNIALTHIKPHGALYNDATDNEALSATLARAVKKLNQEQKLNCALVGMPNSKVEEAAQNLNVRFIAEAFIDRRYTSASRLVPRSQDGAVLESEEERNAQALGLALHEAIGCDDGTDIVIKADSLCIHSDSPGALATANSIVEMLEDNRIAIAAASANQ